MTISTSVDELAEFVGRKKAKQYLAEDDQLSEDAAETEAKEREIEHLNNKN